MLGENVGERRPARQLDADVTIAAEGARARQHEIAEAAQPGERLAPAAGRARQPRDLRQAARDERRQRVVAQAEPFDDAGGDRDDVLQRAADLDADDVVAAVEPEIRAAKFALHELGRPRVGRGREDGRRQLLRHFAREARPRQHDDRPVGSELLRDDLRHAQQRVGFEPFRGADDRRARPDVRRRPPHHRAATVRRNGGDDEVRRRRARVEIER